VKKIKENHWNNFIVPSVRVHIDKKNQPPFSHLNIDVHMMLHGRMVVEICFIQLILHHGNGQLNVDITCILSLYMEFVHGSL
jgi:hypothetical protein